MASQPFLEPFVLAPLQVRRRRDGAIDVYEAHGGSGRRPTVVFVHGGPLPATVRPTPRDWPVFVGYASLAGSSGLVGVTVDHHLHAPSDYARAQDEIAAAVEQVRNLPEVDRQAVALWFFSGAGPLSARWLAEPPDWLRCVALSYPSWPRRPTGASARSYVRSSSVARRPTCPAHPGRQRTAADRRRSHPVPGDRDRSRRERRGR